MAKGVILSQSVPANALARLSEAQLTILNAHLEHELMTNAGVKQQLGSKVQEILKQLGHH